MARKKVEIDFDKLYEILRKKNIKVTKLSEELGFDSAYIAGCKIKGYMYDNTLKNMCAELEIDPSKIMPTKENDLGDEFKTYVKNELREIKKLLNILVEDIEEDDTEIELSPLEKAGIFLNKMLMDTGNCEYEKYIAAAKVAGYDEKTCKQAINNNACVIITKGYGASKGKWITRNREVMK